MQLPPEDTYHTLGRVACAEITVDGSRFIAEASPAGSEEEAQERLEAVRRREHGATHHCWAWRLRAEGDRSRSRSGDDGEPTGTAGAPILRRIEGAGLTDALVVVTRYFGGTKLGTGGLARAYGRAAAEALSAASRERRVLRQHVCLSFAYDDTGTVRRLVDRLGATVEGERYGQRATLVAGVPRSRVDAFRTAFRDATAGDGAFERVEA